MVTKFLGRILPLTPGPKIRLGGAFRGRGGTHELEAHDPRHKKTLHSLTVRRNSHLPGDMTRPLRKLSVWSMVRKSSSVVELASGSCHLPGPDGEHGQTHMLPPRFPPVKHKTIGHGARDPSGCGAARPGSDMLRSTSCILMKVRPSRSTHPGPFLTAPPRPGGGALVQPLATKVIHGGR